MDTGEPLDAWGVRHAHPDGTPLIGARAFIGDRDIAVALCERADIVVCGRVTDASLTVGPCACWHDGSVDDRDALAGAGVGGPIIVCGPHATGVNFSGFRPGLGSTPMSALQPRQQTGQALGQTLHGGGVG